MDSAWGSFGVSSIARTHWVIFLHTADQRDVHAIEDRSLQDFGMEPN